jgi:hypothetical protein
MAEVERHETIRELIHMLKHPFIDAFTEMYSKVQKANVSNRFILREFQEGIKEVSVWTGSKKDEETVRRFKDQVKDVEKSLALLGALNKELLKKEMKSVSVRDFLYSCFLGIAREIWTKPFLFYHRVSKSEYQKNVMAIEKLVMSEIKATIRRIPMADVVVELPEPVAEQELEAPPEPEEVAPEPKVAEVQEPEVEKVEEPVQKVVELPDDIESEDEDNKSDVEDESDNESDEESEPEEIAPRKSKRNHKFQNNALDVYNNYLNPLLVKHVNRNYNIKRSNKN